MKGKSSILFLILFAVAIQKSGAQTCCSGGTPLLGNLGIGSVEKDNIYIQLVYDYNYLNDLYAGSLRLNDESRERLTQSLLLQMVYPLSNRFSVNGLLSYVSQQRTIITQSQQQNITQTSGLGDAVLLIQYTLLSNNKRYLTFAVGPKLPIGKFEATDDEFGLVVSPDLQPGSGSFDLVFGTTYQETQLFSVPTLRFITSFTYRFTTPAQRFEGDQKYRFGNETMISAGIQKNFQLKKTGITPSVFLQYRNTTLDRTDDLPVSGTGGSWAYLNSGLSVELSNNISINAVSELPIYRKLNGTQLTTSYRLNIGLAIKIFRN